MAGKVMDDLLYFGLGAVAAELVTVLTVKYADPRAGMNIAMLGAKAGKPSVYIPGATGAAALGYAIYQGDKFGRLKDEEMALAGYGIFSLVRTVAKVIAPATSVAAAGMRYAPGSVVPRPLPGAGYAPNGVMRGSV